MNRHAGPPADASAPAVPEPAYAERARTLLHLGRTGTLATLSRKHAGYPFASVMPYALDERGRPLMLISSMAMHTQNLMADARASLLVVQATAGDPLAAGRVTVMGEASRVPEAESGAARAAYLDRHANAAYWVDFDDFAFWRLQPADVYFVGGFGAMDWVTAGDYTAAAHDPLADAAASIVERTNADQAAALLACVRAASGEPADEATMVAIDRLGFNARLRTGARVHGVRVPFPREVGSADECREVMAEMFRRP
jgi:heme oxygenase (biliverdin-IX-beta and delta-forming)